MYEEEDTCMYVEEDTCMYEEEEDTCMSCLIIGMHLWGGRYMHVWGGGYMHVWGGGYMHVMSDHRLLLSCPFIAYSLWLDMTCMYPPPHTTLLSFHSCFNLGPSQVTVSSVGPSPGLNILFVLFFFEAHLVHSCFNLRPSQVTVSSVGPWSNSLQSRIFLFFFCFCSSPSQVTVSSVGPSQRSFFYLFAFFCSFYLILFVGHQVFRFFLFLAHPVPGPLNFL